MLINMKRENKMQDNIKTEWKFENIICGTKMQK